MGQMFPNRINNSTMSPGNPQPPYPIHPSVSPRLDPEYDAFYNEHIIDKQQAHLEPLSASRKSGMQAPGSGPLVPVGSVRDVEIPRTDMDGPPLPARCFTPEGPPPKNGWPALVYYHGGGWVLGNIETENVIARNLCKRACVVVVTVDYRLAPEQPSPAAVNDAWDALVWTARERGTSLLSINPSKIATGDSSTGANLAAVMCQRAVNRANALSHPLPLQLLNVPVADNTASPETSASWAENANAPALPATKMLWYRRRYLPNEADGRDPKASPLSWEGDWSRLPPAVMVLDELDLLRTEGERLAEKLSGAGIRADVHVMKGQPHPFIEMDGVLETGRTAITLFCEGLREVMYPGAGE